MPMGPDKSACESAIRHALTCAGLACLISLLLGSPSPGLRAAPPRSSKNPADLASYDALITQEDREHWAFQAVKLPTVPAVKNPEWAHNPIDRFVLARHEEQGLVPGPAAEPRAFLRRLYLDVIRSTADARGVRGVSRRVDALARRDRKLGRRPARPPRVWRTLGTALA